MAKISRPKFSAFIAMSLDGFIATEDGNTDWLKPFQNSNEDYGYQIFYDSVDSIIVGHHTYRALLKLEQWPYERKRVIVLSHQELKHEKIESFSGEILELSQNLFQDGCKHIWVDGGHTLSAFLNIGLIDQMIISIIPIALGKGIPLFQNLQKPLPFRLVYSQSYPNGLIKVHYDMAAI